MVYFFRESGADGRVKIGHSNDIKKRLSSLQSSNPRKLEVLAVVEGGKRTEKNFHRHFADCCCRGEWFRSSKKILSFIEEMKTAGLDMQARLKMV